MHQEQITPTVETIKKALNGNTRNLTFLKKINYQYLVPQFMRTLVRRIIGSVNQRQKKKLTDFSHTNPIDEKGLKKIWPQDKKCVFISTHDIDSNFGQQFVENFFSIEEDLKIRSTNFWVTNLYKINHDLLNTLTKNSFEIGLHDYNHDGKLALLSSENIKRRISLCNEFIKQYSITGIRSPGFLRSLIYYEAIKDFFHYDMSVMDYSYLFPFPGDGCRTSLPFFYNSLLVLPTTLLRDGEGLALGLTPNEILNNWIKKYHWLKDKGGLAVLLTHPDKGFSGNKEMLKIYKTFLQYVSEDEECWITTGKELCNYINDKKECCIKLS